MSRACVWAAAATVALSSPALAGYVPSSSTVYDAPASYYSRAGGPTIDMTTMKGGTPAPFNASALTGFAFEISGDGVPGTKDLRFKIENASGEFCNPGTKPVKKGVNSFKFGDLVKECWKMPTATTPTGESAKADLIKIAWQVVTNASGTVPFDFCVSNVRALQ
jgi:hypothetical protein